MAEIDEQADFTFDALIGAIRELGMRSLATIVPVLVVMVGVGIVGDYYFLDASWYNFAWAIAQFLICYALVRGLARHAGLIEEGGADAGFGGYFVVSFLMGIGISFGYLLLVVPGIVLTVRWLFAFPLLFADRDFSDSRGALSRSWDMTGKIFWKLLAAYCVSLVLMGLGVAAYLYPGELASDTAFLVSISLANCANSAATIFDILLGFAAFMLMRNDKEELAQIFS